MYALVYIASDGLVRGRVDVLLSLHLDFAVALSLVAAKRQYNFQSCESKAPPSQKLDFRRCVAAKSAAMMGDKKFKARVIEVCKEELRPLIHELRGLFFKRTGSSYIYKIQRNSWIFARGI